MWPRPEQCEHFHIGRCAFDKATVSKRRKLLLHISVGTIVVWAPPQVCPRKCLFLFVCSQYFCKQQIRPTNEKRTCRRSPLPLVSLRNFARPRSGGDPRDAVATLRIVLQERMNKDGKMRRQSAQPAQRPSNARPDNVTLPLQAMSQNSTCSLTQGWSGSSGRVEIVKQRLLPFVLQPCWNEAIQRSTIAPVRSYRRIAH